MPGIITRIDAGVCDICGYSNCQFIVSIQANGDGWSNSQDICDDCLNEALKMSYEPVKP